ncbi:hypothetical protein EPH95_02715 [Salicibibacter halophilus]|uniref:Rho termination factor-like N-terminal domain-containing protein n=1 Tax=Salicibibacter halophilus TaxID=2502791 RepID=A0A514LED7_9BACI|nr:Rho termination factor N-terminal domain-containing protein [Salicibibacter halophilus]QDI90216.1 hypothetical protein EPH95_02715 [Salicibibacter halophilus]
MMGIAGFNRSRLVQDAKPKAKQTDYEYLTARDLKELAKDRGIEGYWGLRKHELIEALVRGE